jgi:hypothetical protein
LFLFPSVFQKIVHLRFLLISQISAGKLTYEYKGEVNNASTYQPTEDYILRMENDGAVYKNLKVTESVKNMLKFLNFEGETDEVVACGAPIQNLYIFKCSLEQSLVYLDAIAKSKTIMENFLKKKILFIKSCVSGKYIRDTYDSIRTSLNRIMTMTTPQSKENERFKLMKKIGDEYKRYLNRSLNYGKNMLSFIRTGKLRGRNADMNHFEDEIVDITRMHYEIKAIALKYIFELSYKIIEDDYSGFPMNYGGDIYNEVLTYLNEINEEVTNKYNKKIAIEKAGLINSFKNKVPKIKLSNGKSTLDLLSNKDVNSIKDFILGSGKSTGLSVLSTKSGIKKNLPLDKKDLIKSDKFWKDLRLSMGGKTIYIGVIKYEKPGVFKDKNFYLLDVVNSMIQKKYLRKSPIDTKRKTIRDFLIRSVINNGVLLLVDNTSKLKDPSNWRAMNFDDLDKLGKKKSTSLVRNIFFNIISSNVEFDNIMREEIPDSSLITKEIKELCKLSGPSNLEKCKFIYSRNEFGKGVKRKMNSHSGTKGINLESGTSYAAWTPLEGQVRGALKGGKMVLGFIDK